MAYRTSSLAYPHGGTHTRGHYRATLTPTAQPLTCAISTTCPTILASHPFFLHRILRRNADAAAAAGALWRALTADPSLPEHYHDVTFYSRVRLHLPVVHHDVAYCSLSATAPRVMQRGGLTGRTAWRMRHQPSTYRHSAILFFNKHRLAALAWQTRWT